MNSSKLNVFSISFTIIAIILISLAIILDGTGGGGDSVFHYMYSKYAIEHPENFFNHWAKPVYTMLSCPFAQFGFIGIKLFNVLMSLIACYWGYKTLEVLKIKNREWYPTILFSIILFVDVTLSGLTEPLSAAMIIIAIYFVFCKKDILGVCIISFLPFVRSEGLVMICVFLIYLIVSRKYKFIPWLVTGHIIVAIIGYTYYKDFFWVFNKIPYAHLNSSYGKGTWIHFFEQLYFHFGLIEYSLLIIGLITLLISVINKKSIVPEKLWLIYGCFVAFFFAHTCFWAMGIFNSMGLTRVFVSVVPLAAIIILDSINNIENTINNFLKNKTDIPKYILIIVIVIFPVLNTPSSYKIPDDFKLEESQTLIKKEIVPYLKKRIDIKTIIVADISIPFFLNLDPFDTTKVKITSKVNNLDALKKDEIIIWDNWFSVMEANLTLENLKKIHQIKIDTTFTSKSKSGKITNYVVFSKK